MSLINEYGLWMDDDMAYYLVSNDQDEIVCYANCKECPHKRECEDYIKEEM